MYLCVWRRHATLSSLSLAAQWAIVKKHAVQHCGSRPPVNNEANEARLNESALHLHFPITSSKIIEAAAASACTIGNRQHAVGDATDSPEQQNSTDWQEHWGPQ